MTLRRSATAVWKGNGAEGKGALTTQSGALRDQPYSTQTRFVSEDGRAGTNPEELLGAAHAGCFAMALSYALTGAGHPPDELRAVATVQIDREGVHWSVTGITIELDAHVPGIDERRFQELAGSAKQTCPISKALASVPIELRARLAR